MKFLVFTLFVCAASAASYGSNPYANKPYKPYQSAQQFTKTFNKAAAPFAPVANAPFAAAQVTYNAAQTVATAPVVAAKTVYTATKDGEAAILRSESDVNAEGYNYNYETANGIAAQASGTLKKVDDAFVVVSQGSYRYVAPDGTPVEFSYIADENGYQPQSNLLPVAPAVPEAILRSLEYTRTHPQKPEKY